VIRRRAFLAYQALPRWSLSATRGDTPGGPAGQVYGGGLKG